MTVISLMDCPDPDELQAMYDRLMQMIEAERLVVHLDTVCSMIQCGIENELHLAAHFLQPAIQGARNLRAQIVEEVHVS